MAWRLKIEGWARPEPCPVQGQYVEFYDPTIDPEEEFIYGFTADPAKALTFESAKAAMETWRAPRLNRQGKIIVRPDGNLDRPLTAFHIAAESF